MSRIFYALEEAAERLGTEVAEIEGMVELRELKLVQVGSRRLVHVRDVERVRTRVEDGGPLRARREYRGAMMPEALREAARHLGVPEGDLVYEVLENPQLRMPGIEGRPARIAVELPAGLTAFPEGEDAGDGPAAGPTGAETVRRSGIVALYEVPRPKASEAGPPVAPTPGDDPRAEGRDGEREAPASVGTFYAPEQVARLLGWERSRVNLLIHRRELPATDINEYLWVPEEAVLGLLEREPDRGEDAPPQPFRLLLPLEGARGGPYVYRLGETAEEATREALRERIAELEALVENLRGGRETPETESDETAATDNGPVGVVDNVHTA